MSSVLFRAGSPARVALRARLLRDGVLLRSGVDGIYGYGAEFELIRTRLDAVLSDAARQRGAETLRFPPVFPRRHLEIGGALTSLPQLVGCVCAFDGDETDAIMQADQAANGEDWSTFQRLTDVALVPAACYPVYPAIQGRGPLSRGGVFVDAGAAWVFRREPSDDPMRVQSFRQHELVRVGSPDDVVTWREDWTRYGVGLLIALGLAPRLESATDQFFGRAGRLLARLQLAASLKNEIVVDVAGEPAALASLNLHRDHFSGAFGIVSGEGEHEEVHTGCVGFGHERIVLALYAQHGSDPASWPDGVRDELGLR